jgi:hypothetical protein
MVNENRGWPEEAWRYHPRYKDRPEALLTKDQREYLLGVSDIEPKTARERSMRQNIRRRVADGILDFTILLEHLEDRDRDEIFNDEVHAIDDRDEDLGGVPMGQVPSSGTDMIGFVFQQIDSEYGFENKVEGAIERALYTAGYDAKIDVDITVELTESLDSIRDRLEEQGVDAVSHSELRTLLDAGELSEKEHAKLTLEKEDERKRRMVGAEEWEEMKEERDEE